MIRLAQLLYLRFHRNCLRREMTRLQRELAGLEWAIDRCARESSQVEAALAIAEHERRAEQWKVAR